MTEGGPTKRKRGAEFTSDDIQAVTYEKEYSNKWEGRGAYVGKLKDSRWFWATWWYDSTFDGGDHGICDTEEEAMSNLSEQDREED